MPCSTRLKRRRVTDRSRAHSKAAMGHRELVCLRCSAVTCTRISKTQFCEERKPYAPGIDARRTKTAYRANEVLQGDFIPPQSGTVFVRSVGAEPGAGVTPSSSQCA